MLEKEDLPNALPTDLIHVHLEDRNWQPVQMSIFQTGWKVDLMCPPGRIGYFYTHPTEGVIRDKLEETRKVNFHYTSEKSGIKFHI